MTTPLDQLNARQRAFVEAHVGGASAVEAALSAGYAGSSATITADRLLGNPRVAAAIEWAREHRRADDPDRLRETLCEIAGAPALRETIRFARDADGKGIRIKEVEGVSTETRLRAVGELARLPPRRTPQGTLLSNVPQRCSATRTDGQPCLAYATADGMCFWHSKSARDDMLAASKRGGARRAVELPEGEPLSADRGRGILAAVLEAVVNGALDGSSGRTVGYLLQCDSALREQAELVQRLANVERVLASTNGGARRNGSGNGNGRVQSQRRG